MRKRRLLSLLTALALCVSLLPATALAVEAVGTRFTVQVNEQAYYFEVTNADAESPEVEFTYTGDKNNIGYDTLYTGEINIPATVEYNSVTYTVTSVSPHAVRGTGVTKVTLPNTINKIAASFYSATSLQEVVLNEGLTEIPVSAFYGCTSLTTVNIPSTVTSIGNYAFQSCRSITQLTLPNGLTTIGTGAFSGCNAQSLTIPAGVTDGLAEALVGYSGKVSFAAGSPYDIVDGIVYKSDEEAQTKTAEVVIDDIGENVTIAEGTTHIADNLFYSYPQFPNTQLKSVSLPDSLVSIGEKAFYNCTGLTQINFPDSLVSIGESAFQKCTGLTQIDLPDSLVSIGVSAFEECSGLTEIELPENLTEISRRAFFKCTNLKTVIFSNGVETIGEQVFGNCKSITLAIIPASVTSVGKQAFQKAFSTDGATLVMQGTIPPTFDPDVFGNNGAAKPDNLTYYYPAEAQGAYETAELIAEGDTNGYALSLDDVQLTVGDSTTLSATVPDGMTLDVSSSSAGVATVGTSDNNTISITAAAPGTAAITAQLKVGEYVVLEDTCTVTVTPAPVPAIGIKLDQASVTLYPVSAPNTVTLKATVEPSDSTDAVTWESNNPDVATVENGVVTAHKVGTATITAKAGDHTATCAITVAYAPAESVTLSEASLSLPVSGTVTLDASVTPEDAEPTVVWSSSNEAVAIVNEDGVVTAVSKGEATITATAGGMKAVCVITVTNEGAVLPAVEEPETNTDKIAEADKQTASDVAGSVAADATITSAAQSAANSLNNSSDKEELISKGNAKLEPDEGETVSLYTQTYLTIEATDLTKDENSNVTSITLDITPMVRVVASTATNSADIKLESNGQTNAVVVKEPEALKITGSASITVKLPDSFTNQTVYVKHAASGGTYFYKAVADSNGKLTFTSYHGFSPFTFSLTNEAVAEVNGVGYASFQEAVDAVQDGQSITVYASDLSATVSGNKTFYMTLANGVSQYPNLTAADGYVLLDNGKGLYTVYKRSASSGGVTPPTHDITVDSGSHGDVEIWPEEAKQGTTVTITADPDKGYEVDEVLVTDENGKEITVTDKGNGKYTFMMPGSDVTIEVTFQAVSGGSTSGGDLTITVPAGWVNPYTDVAANAWYYDAVGYASANGLMGGVGNNAFAPSGSMNRAMVWTVIARLAGQTISGESWAADAQAWAVAAGVSDGSNPDGSVSREELVTMLYRYAGSPAMNVPELALIGGYPDSANVSAWAQNAFAWAISRGIIEGRDGQLAAGESVTRAEAATILARFHLLTK